MRRDLYDFYEAGDEDVDDISVVKPQKNNKVRPLFLKSSVLRSANPKYSQNGKNSSDVFLLHEVLTLEI